MLEKRILHIENYPDLLSELPYSSTEIRQKIAGFHLAFSSTRNRNVEQNRDVPMFAYSFYEYIKELRYIPTQDEAYGYYSLKNKDVLVELHKNIDLEDIKARFNRAYPSLMRDYHFNKFISEHLPGKFKAIYNTRLDVEEGIDLLIVSPNANYGICFYTNTNRGNDGRKWKENRHVKYDNISYIEFALNMNSAEHVGEFLLYGESNYRELLQLLTSKETEYNKLRPLYDESPRDTDKYKLFLLFYSVKAACGAFIEGGYPEELGWINIAKYGFKGNENRFVVQASGNSMLPKIHNGDYCIFERNWAGTRNGQIVLAQSRDFDDDYSGKYTIKKYHSESSMSDDWEVQKTIELIPLNDEYDVIHLSDEEDVSIVGVLVGIIDGNEKLPAEEPATVQSHIGYCIQCGKPIDYTFGDDKPRAEKPAGDLGIAKAVTSKQLAQHCHRCGKPYTTTFEQPLCSDYLKEINNR